MQLYKLLQRIVGRDNVSRVATPKSVIRVCKRNNVTHIVSTGSNLRFTRDYTHASQIICNMTALAVCPTATFLGVCYGFQLLATVFGGNVVAKPNGGVFGSENITDVDTGEVMTVAGYHNDIVVDAGRGFDTVHVNNDDRGIIQTAIRKDECRTLIGVQWHPEQSGRVGYNFLLDTFLQDTNAQ